MLPRTAWISLGLAVALAGGGAARAAPGEHIRIGDGTVITPAVAVGVEGQTNAYRARQGREVGAFNFLFSPSLTVRVRAPKVHFDFDGRYELRKFFEPDVAEDLDRFSDFYLNGQVDVLPRGVVGFRVFDRAALINRSWDQAFRSNALITQLRNDLGAELVFRPGPELAISPGFTWALHDYSIPGAIEQVDFARRNTIAPTLDLEWRFFPNTAFVVEGRYERHHWTENWISTNQPAIGAIPEAILGDYGQFIALPDAQHLKVTTGIRGRITRRLVLELLAGYGFGDYDPDSVIEEAGGPGGEADPEAEGFDADVSLTDAILVVVRPVLDLGYTDRARFGQRITLAYRKDFQDSFFTNYVHQHAVSGSLESRWGRHLATHVGGVVRFEDYVGELEREDLFVQVSGWLDVTPVSWLALRFGADWSLRDSTDDAIDFSNVLGRVTLEFVY